MNSLSMNRLLTRPPATLSPIGEEGRGEGVVHGSQCVRKSERRVSMNRLLVAASGQSAAGCCSHELRRSAETPLRQGSWPQHALAKSWELSMNHPSPLPSPPVGERVAGGRVTGTGLGSWSRGAILEYDSWNRPRQPPALF